MRPGLSQVHLLPVARCVLHFRFQLCNFEYCYDCAQLHPPCYTDDETSTSEDEAFTQATVKDTCQSVTINGFNGFPWMSAMLSLLLVFGTVINYFYKVFSSLGRTLGKSVRKHWTVVIGLVLFFTAMPCSLADTFTVSPVCWNICNVTASTSDDLLMIDSGAGVCVFAQSTMLQKYHFRYCQVT